MELELSINGVITSQEVAPNETLLPLLRRAGCSSVKAGCETGECGACTVLIDGVPRPSCVMLAAQAGGCTLTTVESLENRHTLHPLQQAFVDVGAAQCGFCTPGMLLASYALLKRNPAPTEDEVRDALSGNLCRCSGYAKPVQAVLRAAAAMRGQQVEPLDFKVVKQEENHGVAHGSKAIPMLRLPSTGANMGSTAQLPVLVRGLVDAPMHAVSKPLPDSGAKKLVMGKPVFTADLHLHGMLYAGILTSPHAHARIRSIDVSQAKALSGVHAVLTYQDLPHIPYASTGRSPLEEGVRDCYSLDSIVRYVGDRVAVVAAETPELVQQALRLIAVEYEVLPAVLDLRQATDQSAPAIHQEAEAAGIFDAKRNIAARVRSEHGEVERGFAEADLIVEDEYVVPLSQQAPLEKHTVITYFDENDNLVVRTNSQAPQHIRRVLASLLNVSTSHIRVVQPEVGGGAGAKLGVVLEDLCALLTMATNRPVLLAHSRQEEFARGGTRAQYILRLKTGVKQDGTIIANQMILLANTGAHATHPLIGYNDAMDSALNLYPCPNMRFVAEVLYTNLPPVGIYQGYGAFQEFFALESHIDEIARRLDMDALELRRKNWIKVGDEYPLAHGSAVSSVLESSGLAECARIVEEQLDWKERRGATSNGRTRRGIGLAVALHGHPLASPLTGGAIIKLSEDGSFDVFASANDAGNDTATMLAQVIAEILGTQTETILMHTSGVEAIAFDAEATPADVFYASGEAVMKAAEQVRRQILAMAGRMLNVLPESLKLDSGLITAPDGQRVTIRQVATHSLCVESRYIMASVSAKVQNMPTSFAVQGVEVEVDSETGVVRVLKAVSAVDAGRALNPLLMERQIQGGVMQGLSSSLCEELLYDQKGALLTTNFQDYHIYNTLDLPELQTYLVETTNPVGLFGAKSVAEISLYGVAPALANAIADALGVRLHQLPLTPERVLRAIHAHAAKR
jgi:putative selenate reductase molybdopterin-binding subunit